MARPGYIEARNRYWQAELSLTQATRGMAELDRPGFEIGKQLFSALSPALQEMHRSDRQKTLDKARAENDQAKQAFAPYEREPKAERIFYDEQFVIKLGCSREMGNLIRQKLDEGTSLAELVRQALQKYFDPALS